MTRRRWFIFYGALGFAAIVFVDAEIDPHVVFVSPTANNVAIQLMLLMPAVMAIAGPSIREGAVRFLRYGLLLAASGGVGLAALLQVAVIWFGPAPPPIVWSAGSYTIATYERQGDLADNRVDQVCRLAPGILIAQSLRDFNGDPSQAISVVDPNRIRVQDDTLTLTPVLWPGC
jgi:hypothetical protein